MKKQIDYRVFVYPSFDKEKIKLSPDYTFQIDIDDELMDDRMRVIEFEDKIRNLVRSFKSLGYGCNCSVMNIYLLDD